MLFLSIFTYERETVQPPLRVPLSVLDAIFSASEISFVGGGVGWPFHSGEPDNDGVRL